MQLSFTAIISLTAPLLPATLRRSLRPVVAATALLLLATTAQAAGTTRYVRPTGTDAGACTSQGNPCRTITYGISQMAAGDTLIVGNGTYTSTTNVNALRYMPSGNAGPDGVPGTGDDVYTTVMAETDFGVVIDGRQWSVPDTYGLFIWGSSYIKIRGFRIFASQPGVVVDSHHIKIIRNGFAYADTTGNTTTMAVGNCDYVLLEENYAYGGARYQFLVFQSNHTVARRNVARNDYYNDVWQSAAFTNYDSANTSWQNNIAIDSDESCCAGHGGLWGGFWNENHDDANTDTSEELLGNIVLNYGTRYEANVDSKVSGNHLLTNNIFWDSSGGYYGAQGPGIPATIALNQMTIGAMKHVNYGSGAAVYIGPGVPNSVKNSILANSYHGSEGYVAGNYNAYSGNGANFGGNYDGGNIVPNPGPNDIFNVNITTGVLKYLPRGPEAGSALANAGEGGARVGAQVLWKYGVDGTLYGEPGWNVLRSPENGYGRSNDGLWPWATEDIIKVDMAAYTGPGLLGPRGFAAPGNGLYGGPRTLTSYIWEYLGAPCPASVCRPAPILTLDTPTNATFKVAPFVVNGWAVDRSAATGTGIDAVHVYAFPSGGGAPTFLGAATYGGARADVGAIYGSQFTNSAFSLKVSSLANGVYTIQAFGHSSVTGTFSVSSSALVYVQPAPAMSVDSPVSNGTFVQKLTVSGWAVDRAASNDAGVDGVHVWAFPSGGGAPLFLGAATYGLPRPDIASLFGSQFANAGYRLQVDVPPGTYTVNVYMHSTASGTFNAAMGVANVKVTAPVPNPLLAIDTPTSGASRTRPFTISGWAADMGASAGTGMDAVHVWAYPTSGAPAVFVGAANYGVARPDVAAVLGNSRFTNSGYSLTATSGTLPAGTYDLNVFGHSTVTGTFNIVRVVRVTVF